MRAYEKSVLVTVALVGSLAAMGQTNGSCARCALVQRQPYMAEFKVTHVQTLADGTTITRETREVSAVDSQGRRLNSNSMMVPGNTANAQEMHTTVSDPVGNTRTTWDSRTKEARTTKLPPEDQRHGCWANDAGNYRINYGPLRPPSLPVASANGTVGAGGGAASFSVGGFETASGNIAPGSVALPSIGSTSTGVVSSAPGAMPRAGLNKPQQENLGTDVIQGVEVHGSRMTMTIPIGQIGNDRPIVTMHEYWTAPSLGGIILRSVSDSPQSGKQTREVVSLSVGDPDPSVFQPPEGYKVTIEELHEVACQQTQP